MSDLKISFQKNMLHFNFPLKTMGNLSQLNTFCSKAETIMDVWQKHVLQELDFSRCLFAGRLACLGVSLKIKRTYPGDPRGK